MRQALKYSVSSLAMVLTLKARHDSLSPGLISEGRNGLNFYVEQLVYKLFSEY